MQVAVQLTKVHGPKCPDSIENLFLSCEKLINSSDLHVHVAMSLHNATVTVKCAQGKLNLLGHLAAIHACTLYMYLYYATGLTGYSIYYWINQLYMHVYIYMYYYWTNQFW